MSHPISTKIIIPHISFCIPESTIIGEDLAARTHTLNLFFGTGLCSSTEMSSGLPFDFMEFLYRR